MNPSALQKLVADAITDNVFMNWRFYVALLSVGILCTVGAALLEGWGKKKGEIAATKADFQEILRQLQETTTAAKSVELALAHNDWIQRERNALKRAKLEQLIACGFSIARWVEREAGVAVVDDTQEGVVSIDQFEMLATLYFPELSSQSDKIQRLYREAYAHFMEIRIAVADNKFAIETAWAEKRTEDAARLIDERKQHAQSSMPEMVKKSHSVYEAAQELARSAHTVMEQLTAQPNA